MNESNRRNNVNGSWSVLAAKIILSGVVIAAMVLYGDASSAFNKADIEKLKATKACEKCNLRGANLAGADLSKSHLSGAELIGTNLRRANLSGADLSGASLIDAVLSEADLTGANLANADLSGSYMTGTKLAGADLSGAKWADGVKCKAGSVGKCNKEPGRVKK
jgi:uncharacterized protein YjbI with pentapeptide repeats